ncbi:hypothetical protein DWQ65_03870 [Treponema phagedenis]|nr:hypothetical protein C5O78_07095 [Treponema phagedenis]QSH99218.1 hypothetical protein DWQ65_03870 [Treponema phagedenis]
MSIKLSLLSLIDFKLFFILFNRQSFYEDISTAKQTDEFLCITIKIRFKRTFFGCKKSYLAPLI